MKHLAFSLLTLLLAFGVKVNAQGQSSQQGASKPCDMFKIGIIAPPKDIDFKMIIIVPPKGLDEAMVINTCPQQAEVASAPRIIVPLKEASEFFKLPPFAVKNKYPQ